MKNKFHHLNLDRPLVIFDLETTGIDTQQDRIIELAAVKYTPGANAEQFHTHINPQRPISSGATAVHGITQAMVESCPVFNEVAGWFSQFLGNADLGGFNLKSFDLPLLLAEYRR